MAKGRYTLQQVAEGEHFYNLLKCAPQDKQAVVELVTEAFINGMNAQERLAASTLRQES